MKGATGPFGDYISMGGLFTMIKIGDRLKSYDRDPGWYQHPSGTVALQATDEELTRDGIEPKNHMRPDSDSAKGHGHYIGEKAEASAIPRLAKTARLNSQYREHELRNGCKHPINLLACFVLG